MEIYSYVNDQLLLSGMGDETISINLLAVEKFIEKTGYKKPLETLTKVLGLSKQIIQYKREKKQRES